MPKSKPLRTPKEVKAANPCKWGATNRLAVPVALLAGIAALYVQHQGKSAGVAERLLSMPSPVEEQLLESCEVLKPLWGGIGCRDFLREHWETSPLVSHQAQFLSEQLLHLENITQMVKMWPFRFKKNHATAVLQKPASGFLADERWPRGEAVPHYVVDVALREQLTLVLHNLEVYWPPIARFVWHVNNYFHAYTQVNLYLSPAELEVATAPHQDAHSVFIVQLQGAKRWSVHAPRTPLTLKAKQRGKQGDVVRAGDRRLMGGALLETTLRPGSVLYVPRAFFHHTSTATSAESFEPSVALTVSITSEDVFTTWLHLLGEALEQAPPHAAVEAERLKDAMRKQAVLDGDSPLGSQLREALPRAIMAPHLECPCFASTSTNWQMWRSHALQLLRQIAQKHPELQLRWLRDEEDAYFLYTELDKVLARKKVPNKMKMSQIEAFLNAMDGLQLSYPQANVNITQIFMIEKQDKSYVPVDRTWHAPWQW
uniref:Bifunctional lysine-specific demethylase and histidyl-hydroxylase n=1 Tax=Chrysotila carterae TaxID=13221 RepID=A0A7S4FAL1_CHRCT